MLAQILEAVELLGLVEKFGPVTAFFFLSFLFIKRFSNWAAPLVNKVVEAHVDLMEEIKVSQPIMAKTLEDVHRLHHEENSVLSTVHTNRAVASILDHLIDTIPDGVSQDKLDQARLRLDIAIKQVEKTTKEFLQS